MFHRMKSETPSEDAQVKPKPFQSAEVKEFKRPEPQETEIQEDDTIEIIGDLEDNNEDQALESEVAEEDSVAEDDESTTEDITTSKKEAETMNQLNEEQDKETETAPAAQAYQPVNAPARGGYPGAYPGYSTSAPAAEASGSAADRRLTIGAGITMSGEIESCDYLLVEGTVEAALKGASVLDIAETGVFYGTVEIEDATIAGRFEGDITAHGRLTLREGATVTGTIAYKELEIEAGAVIDGKLTPLQAVQSGAKRPSAAKKEVAAKPAPAKEVKASAPAKPEPANTDGSLFTKAAAAAE